MSSASNRKVSSVQPRQILDQAQHTDLREAIAKGRGFLLASSGLLLQVIDPDALLVDC
jgi:repressor of nif and glnA expression